MEELVKQVAQRTGISEDNARTAVTTVLGFLKDKLPAPIAGQIDSVVGGRGSCCGSLLVATRLVHRRSPIDTASSIPVSGSSSANSSPP